jgi:hypothetical protein
MKKNYILLLCLLAAAPAIFAQKVAHAAINKQNISLRGNPTAVGQVTIQAPSAGKVILRFDGHCVSSLGDRIVLAASKTTNWGAKDDNVEVEAYGANAPASSFSHTRAYDVAAGEHTFYAVAQNFFKMDGNGMASIYGSLTAEWFPEIPGQPFARHNGFSFENIYIEGAPIPFNSLTIDAPVSGKVLVRFDGKCISGYGDLIFFAASNTPTWTNLDGSTSNEVVTNDINCFSFSHTRSYDVAAGSHTFYAVVENFYEIYGNGFASIYGSLTVQFYPAAEASKLSTKPITTPFGVNVEGPPVTVGTMNVNAPVAGKIAVNFVGTCITTFGDKIRLAASNVPNWLPDDGNIEFKAYSSDINRMSFSHTRVYDVAPGDHTFYAVIQNVEEFNGSGLAVIYATMNTKFFAEGTIAVAEPEVFKNVRVSPNPSTDYVRIEFPDLSNETFSLSLSDASGRILRTFEKASNTFSDQISWEVSALPTGVYFLKMQHTTGTTVRQIVRI